VEIIYRHKPVADSPIKLQVPPDDYPVMLSIPASDGTPHEVTGTITLSGGAFPTAKIWGNLPLKQTVVGAFTFPQYFEYPVLKGKLSTNQDVILINARMSAYAIEHATLYADLALVGNARGAFVDSFTEIRFQVEHLDRCLSFAPIYQVQMPLDQKNPSLAWSVTERESRYEYWQSEDGTKLTAGFDGLVKTGDPYTMRLRYIPICEVKTEKPFCAGAVFKEWVRPISGLISVLTGVDAKVTHVELRAAGEDGAALKLQLYARWITQSPYASAERTGSDISPAMRLGPDAGNLLELALAWRREAEERSPVFETYTSMAGIQDDHPRHRFLLLIQSIEGHYGHANRARLDEENQRYQARRAELLQHLEISKLEEKWLKFARKNLVREKHGQLREALQWSIASLPRWVEDGIAASTLVQEVLPSLPNGSSWRDALAEVRNGLAHGARGFDPYDLRNVVMILEKVVRAQVLVVLGADLSSINTMFDDR
jgi:hypothetical protein